MQDKSQQQYDLSEEGSKRGSDNATAAARQAESDDLYDGPGLATTPTPEGDDAAENKVATSLDDE